MPTRGALPAAGADWPRAAVYVGRGSAAWELQPSEWGTPFKIGQLSREEVIKLHADWLARQPDLKSQIGELTGAILMCHCAAGQACHADNLIALWHCECGVLPAPVWKVWQVYIDNYDVIEVLDADAEARSLAQCQPDSPEAMRARTRYAEQEVPCSAENL